MNVATIRTGIGAEEYHADEVADTPTLSSSLVHTLTTRSPLHAWTEHPKLNPDYRRREESKFDLGSAAHALLLEGVDRMVELDFPDWRTNAAKEARDAARATGNIPMLSKDAARVTAMLKPLHAWIAVQPEPRPFTDGQPERIITWTDRDVACRAMVDWLHDDFATVDDYKTTDASAHPLAWSRSTFYAIGADIQAAFYTRGLTHVTGIRPAWRYIVQEVRPPFAIAVIEPGADVIQFANRKIDAALDTWRGCLASGVWPSYPSRVATATLAPWELSRWEDREAFTEMGELPT